MQRRLRGLSLFSLAPPPLGATRPWGCERFSVMVGGGPRGAVPPPPPTDHWGCGVAAEDEAPAELEVP